MDISLPKQKNAFVFICFWFFLFNILSINTALLFSQSPEYISARILDSNTYEPVSFATVWLQNSQLGVIANAEADFRFRNDLAHIEDSLVISCIGYERKTIPFEFLSGNELKIIYLTPSVYDLGEVQIISLIKDVNSRKIIRKAIRHITDNYPITPFSYTSYYRDYQKRNGKYINLNEAIIQTMDTGFGSKDEENQYVLLDYMQNEDFPRIQLSPFYVSNKYLNYDKQYKIIPRARMGDHYGNELFVLLVHDPIRNFDSNSFSFIDKLSKDFLKNHVFSKPKPIFNNDLLLYKIEFETSPRIILDTLFVNGTIYIQPADYSIHKLEYACRHHTDTGDKNIFSVTIEYGYESSIDSHMYLKYISFNNLFNVVDTTDNDYFQILDSYWLTESNSKPTMVFKFNRPLDIESALNKNNYQIINVEDPIKIREITIDEDSLSVWLHLQKDPVIRKQLQVNMVNIMDKHGNNLNQRRLLEFVQYRELFVQDYNNTLAVNDTCFVKPIPLEQNCISRSKRSNIYWMNTPIGIAGEK